MAALWIYAEAEIYQDFLALNLPTKPSDQPKPLSLASFRPGGATLLITVSESVELVRRRGCWITNKIMECYLQEVTSMTYLNEISPKSKSLVLQALDAFPSLLRAIINFHTCNIPANLWFFFLRKSPS